MPKAPSCNRKPPKRIHRNPGWWQTRRPLRPSLLRLRRLDRLPRHPPRKTSPCRRPRRTLPRHGPARPLPCRNPRPTRRRHRRPRKSRHRNARTPPARPRAPRSRNSNRDRRRRTDRPRPGPGGVTRGSRVVDASGNRCRRNAGEPYPYDRRRAKVLDEDLGRRRAVPGPAAAPWRIQDAVRANPFRHHFRQRRRSKSHVERRRASPCRQTPERWCAAASFLADE